MTRRFTAAVLLAGCIASSHAQAVLIEGQRFEPQIEIADTRLRLNGVGLRAVAWLKGYAAGLYLAERASTEAAAVAAPGPKRLQMKMLLDVPAEEFTKAIDKGFRRNTPEAEQPRLAERQQQWNRAVLAIGKVKQGDTVNLDYVPGRGMTMTLNGKTQGAVLPGDDFYAAVLRIFVGERPVDVNLKAGLLGQRPLPG